MGSSSIIEAIRAPDNGRQSWNDFHMGMAEYVAKRSTCARLKVGAVFIRNNRVLVTGFNGSLPGRPHCDDVGCMVHEGHCISSVHAEENCVAQAAQHGVSLEDSYLFVNYLPCLRCYKLVLAAGCSRVYFKQQYGTADLGVYRQLQGMSRLEQLT